MEEENQIGEGEMNNAGKPLTCNEMLNINLVLLTNK